MTTGLLPKCKLNVNYRFKTSLTNLFKDDFTNSTYTMKHVKLLALSAMVLTGVSSCQNEDVSKSISPQNLQVSKLHLIVLGDAGVNINAGDIRYEIPKGLPGDIPETELIAGDLRFNIKDLENGEYSLSKVSEVAKQFRTNNLISRRNRSFRVVGFTGSCCALTSKMRRALELAVANYNRLNSTLNLNLIFSSNFNDSDMVVYNNGASGGGGQAGFPSRGQAFKRVQINQGTDSFSVDVIEHVITHEIGHSIGLRHQDYVNRQSCGQNVNEGSSGVGAILINGTPSSPFSDSIMLACFGPNEDGEFTRTDRIAIETMY